MWLETDHYAYSTDGITGGTFRRDFLEIPKKYLFVAPTILVSNEHINVFSIINHSSSTKD